MAGQPEAAALTHAELEVQLTVRGRELLRLMLQGQPSATSESSAAPRRNASISSILGR
jgi:DNA-binding CsgD family transcriptional regulator